jgi:predicted lactoylglutathione lyase
MDYHKINPNWNFPNYYYTKEYFLDSGEKMQQIFIDTTFFDESGRKKLPHLAAQSKQKQLDWLKQVLEEGKEKYRWRFVYGHHVMYNSNFKDMVIQRWELW